MATVKGIKLENKGKVYTYEDVAILNGKRTPFGKFKGTFSTVTATELGVSITQKLLQCSQLSPEMIDQVIFANTIPSSTDAIFLPRHIALKSGCNFRVPASMVQRICASGMESIIIAANDICLNCSDYIIAGGTENMTRAPLVSFDIRNGIDLGQRPFYDLLWEGLKDTYCGYSMAETAENLAEKYNITRESVDEYAYLSHSRASKASELGIFKDEICESHKLFDDETIRRETNLEKLKELKPVFRKNGVQTAGNSSQIADGAAAMIITHMLNNLKPLGYLLGASIIGEQPEIMGIAPVMAIENLLHVAGLSMDDIDLWEINEAFSAQYLAVEKVLELDRNKVNVNGGSIAIGHPLAATGLRLVNSLLYELNRRKARYGIVSACVGGGQGTALLLESNCQH